MAMSAGVFWRLDLLFTFPLSPMPRLHRHNPSGGRPLLYTRLYFAGGLRTSLFTSSVMTVMAKSRGVIAGEHG